MVVGAASGMGVVRARDKLMRASSEISIVSIVTSSRACIGDAVGEVDGDGVGDFFLCFFELTSVHSEASIGVVPRSELLKNSFSSYSMSVARMKSGSLDWK